MKKIILIATAVLFCSVTKAQVYSSVSSEVSFYSKTPIEDIDATNKNPGSIFVLNTATSALQVKLVMKDFKFPKPLMEEHFNEKYVESDQFPTAVFKGTVNEKIDYTKDGTHKTTVKGKLTLHGVEKEYLLEGTITVKGNQVMLDTKFKIKLVDHNIAIPTAVITKIAEEIDVHTTATLEPFKKK